MSNKQQRLALLQEQQAFLETEIREELKQEQNLKNNIQPNENVIEKYLTDTKKSNRTR